MARSKYIECKQGDDLSLPLFIKTYTDPKVPYIQRELQDEINKGVNLDMTTVSLLQEEINLRTCVDLENVTITSSISWSTRYIHDLVVDKTDTRGGIILRLSSDVTSNLVPRTYRCDIRFEDEEGKQSSRTFEFVLTKKVKQ